MWSNSDDAQRKKSLLGEKRRTKEDVQADIKRTEGLIAYTKNQIDTLSQQQGPYNVAVIKIDALYSRIEAQKANKMSSESISNAVDLEGKKLLADVHLLGKKEEDLVERCKTQYRNLHELQKMSYQPSKMSADEKKQLIGQLEMKVMPELKAAFYDLKEAYRKYTHSGAAHNKLVDDLRRYTYKLEGLKKELESYDLQGPSYTG